MRDLVLAKQFEEVIFAVKNLDGNINDKIPYKKIIIENNNELFEIIKTENIDMIVIDNYDINYEFEKELHKFTKVMVVDDFYQKHYCDILLNHNIYAQKDKYLDLVPSFCEIRCGKKYTLIREEFKISKKFPKTNKNFTIFVAMGGADTANLTIPIIEILKDYKCEINVVTTSANKNLDNLKDIKNINLYINSNEIAKIMRNSDLAIVTPSVILNEVFYMEMDFIAIQTADNQQEMRNYLKKNNFKVLEKFDGEKLKNELNKFCKLK